MNTNKFDNFTNSIFKESVGTITRNSLDPTVFQFPDDGRSTILQDGIKSQILTNISAIESFVPVVRIYLTGEITTPFYSNSTIIDVIIEADPEAIDNISAAEVLFNINRLNGKLAIGTTHPISYHVVPGEIDLNKFEAVYDIVNERWIKKPDEVNPNIVIHLTQFNETLQSIDLKTGKILRNLIDVDNIKQLNNVEQEALRFYIQKKADKLQAEIGYLTIIYKHLYILQKLATDRTLTVDEILYYSEKYKLPENITYKFLEKFYYNKFMEKLDTIINNEDYFNIPQLIKHNRVGQEFRKA